MKSRYSLLALLVTASLLTACSSPNTPAAPSPSSPAPSSQTPASQEPADPSTPTPPANTTPADPQAAKDAALPVTLAMSNDYKTVTITKGGKIATTVKVENDPTSGPMVNTLKQTEKSVYFNTCATGFGGYINYAFCYGPTYRFDRTTNAVTKLLNDGQMFDISANEDMFVWVENGNKSAHQIKIRTIATGKDQIMTVPAKYGQYGDAKFSPDAKKIAYAAIIGDSENEKGSVIIIDLATGKETYIAQDKANSIYTVKGWKDNTTVDYTVVDWN